MARQTLEERVEALEKKVAQLSSEPRNGTPAPAWTETIGMFTDDPGMLEIFAEAMRIREVDRTKVRRQKKRTQRVSS